jgi:hypothetical protein
MLNKHQRPETAEVAKMFDVCASEADILSLVLLMEQFPTLVSNEVRNLSLSRICTLTGSFSVGARTLFSSMLSKGRVDSNTALALFPHLGSVREVEALAADVIEMKLATKSVGCVMIEAFLRCAKSLTLQQQRGSAWWLPATLKALSAGNATPTLKLHVASLVHLASLGHTRAGASLYSAMAKYVPAARWDPEVLETLIAAWGKRPAPRSPEVNTKDTFSREFLVQLWNDLEAASSRRSRVPSVAAHISMMRLLAMRADLPFLQPLLRLFMTRFPVTDDKSVDSYVVQTVLCACARAESPADAVSMFKELLPNATIDKIGLSLLFASINSIPSYHHTSSVIALAEARLTPVLGVEQTRACIQAELELLALRVAVNGLNTKRQSMACIPVPRAPWEQTEVRPLYLCAWRRGKRHVLRLTRMGNGWSVGKERVDDVDEVFAALNSSAVCSSLGCFVHS